MIDFNAAHLEIQTRELVKYLLRESGQTQQDSVNVADIVKLLRLNFEILDIKTVFTQDFLAKLEPPRAMLSFPDKLIVLNNDPNPARVRFSVLHEIGHYVLPNHQYNLYVCDDAGFHPSTQILFEKEANEFAAELLFMGDQFILEANSKDVCALTVKQLAEKFKASFESTARRLVEKNLRPCMLIVFDRKKGQNCLDAANDDIWEAKYCIASKTFRVQYFTRVEGTIPEDVIVELKQKGGDIANSVIKEIPISSASRTKTFHFKSEFFTNSYNIFSFWTPIN